MDDDCPKELGWIAVPVPGWEGRNAYLALEAWKRWWERSDGDPFGSRGCIFCYEPFPDHEEDCPYLIVKQIAEEEGW